MPPDTRALQLTVTTWNINSLRFRLDQVGRFLADARPDVLCLQETKCPDGQLPLNALHGFGYAQVAHVGQKGYNGVVILSRYPFSTTQSLAFCGRQDARHIAVTLGPEAGAAAGVAVHNFYVPAGGDIADPAVNLKFAHKLAFLDEMRAWAGRAGSQRRPTVLVGDLNVAPLEHDVWSHRQLLKVVSHTPVETEALESVRMEGGWIDAARRLRPEPEKLFTWWSYRAPDWKTANKGRRLDHVWLSAELGPALVDVETVSETRGWERPSDHVPVTATLEL